MAITMYKKARMYDQMIRLVSQHRKDNLPQVRMGRLFQFVHEAIVQFANLIGCFSFGFWGMVWPS